MYSALKWNFSFYSTSGNQNKIQLFNLHKSGFIPYIFNFITIQFESVSQTIRLKSKKENS